ncbi:TPA: hypothetical protein JBD69_13280 [Legionella pneumophila subsp. pneumophila]|nr:hypothetical protein [Legionella pneumophila subsp. pneumophila]
MKVRLLFIPALLSFGLISSLAQAADTENKQTTATFKTQDGKTIECLMAPEVGKDVKTGDMMEMMSMHSMQGSHMKGCHMQGNQMKGCPMKAMFKTQDGKTIECLVTPEVGKQMKAGEKMEMMGMGMQNMKGDNMEGSGMEGDHQ